ncbi:hypothetical protein [Bacillus sp. JCM 19034]|uniref:hypothetical protein n=1 Tax=Bacillus sp. JCM 19034 TaxID=1481928 RepID=UPI0007814103|nr:hypothetical protein [Bacillus sp. JCM 19034]
MHNYEWRFAEAGCVLIVLFLIVVNYVTSFQYHWLIHPFLAVFILPFGIYSFIKNRHKSFSLVGSFSIVIYLLTENYMSTPNYPWFLYAVAPVFLWPILTFIGKRNKQMVVALTISVIFILYYVILNIFLEPLYPWSIFPAFLILWWPLSLYHAKRNSYFSFSIHATLLISILFICTNVFFSPSVVWAVYPIFGVLWWPLSMYYFSYRREVS